MLDEGTFMAVLGRSLLLAFNTLLAVPLLAIPLSAWAFERGDFDQLMSAIRDGRYAVVESFLAENEDALRADPEYYVILLNYVIRKGQTGGLVIAAGEPQAGDLALSKEGSDEVVGFIGTRESLDEALILDGISRAQKALPQFESRLDVHFGIVSVAERIRRWDIVGDQLVQILRVSREIDNRWEWGPINSMEGDRKHFMIQNVLSRTSTLFRAEDPKADQALIRVSKAMIEHYPDLVYGYANLGALALAKGENEEARRHLNRALEVDPQDEVVRGNLAILDQRED